jgi:cobalamin synthase
MSLAVVVGVLFALTFRSGYTVSACAALIVPKATMMALAWVSRPPAEGSFVLTKLRSWTACLVIAVGLGSALLCGIARAALMILASYIIVRVARELAYRSRGGVDGRTLSVAEHATAVAVVLIVTFI